MMTREQLQAAAAKLRTLEEATRWSFGSGATLVDVITQDEFTHDVVFAVESCWLVFDTT